MEKLFLFITAIFIYSCMGTSRIVDASTCISLVEDTTDKVSVMPQANAILRLYQLDKYPDQEAIFRFKVIKNVKLIPVTTYHLMDAENMRDDGDPQARNKAVVKFYDEITSEIKKFQKATNEKSELPNSECLFSIKEELWYLSSVKCARKILIVCSNLFEKSFIDLYKQNLSAGALSKLFEKTYPLPNNLKGLQVFFVFDPGGNRVEDQRYQTVAEAYKILLEARGATVSVQADANQFETQNLKTGAQ